ncbi:hypothetical protein NMG60_11002351, partial [Bertholletia excelsa]
MRLCICTVVDKLLKLSSSAGGTFGSASLLLVRLALSVFSAMAGGENKSEDFYAVLGLKKECSAEELRNAYKKLALSWHPDRCSASGNSRYVEEAKKKFQAIQEAYSVLSDENKRFLYDVGVYDSDDDENGMGDFLSEMAVLMSQNKSDKNGEESFEELQELFNEMFQSDVEGFSSASQAATPPSGSTSLYASFGESSHSGKAKVGDFSGFDFDAPHEGFCLGGCRGKPRRQKGLGGGPPGGAG